MLSFKSFQCSKHGWTHEVFDTSYVFSLCHISENTHTYENQFVFLLFYYHILFLLDLRYIPNMGGIRSYSTHECGYTFFYTEHNLLWPSQRNHVQSSNTLTSGSYQADDIVDPGSYTKPRSWPFRTGGGRVHVVMATAFFLNWLAGALYSVLVFYWVSCDRAFIWPLTSAICRCIINSCLDSVWKWQPTLF